MTFHRAPGIYAVRAFGWQLDYRANGYLPFSIRHGRRKTAWHILPLGRFGCATLGRVIALDGKSAA
jgi:hypothetical protein